jgi:SAM-dependent methyltransferase
MRMEWFKNWFDSPYYHLLYSNRDAIEAQKFIDQLLDFLQPSANARMLDLACGRGRHAIYLAKKGFQVTGIDLSPQSIAFAKQEERENLDFYIADMRKTFRINYYDYVFNFFTSFGYFFKEKDHLKSIQSISKGLKPNGYVVIDFFNSHYVIDHLVTSQIKEVEGTTFNITKRIDQQFIRKNITFDNNGTLESITERVRLFKLEDFQRMFSQSGLHILNTFGDYKLSAFDKINSPRLIIIGQKK